MKLFSILSSLNIRLHYSVVNLKVYQVSVGSHLLNTIEDS